VARITKAPRHLSIQAMSGAMAGSQSGYSERWFWRHNLGEPMKPYAEVTLDADQMAARRFALLGKNYLVTLGAPETVDGRRAQVLELRPRHAIDGARGPARRLFVDVESALTLRIDAFNCALKPISRSSLSKLDLAPPITPVTFEAPQAIMASLETRDWQGEELAQKHQMAARKTGFLPPRPTFLPPGFELDGYGVHRCLTTGTLQLSAFSRYTDGLNTLTVFAFKPSNSNIKKTMRGACNFGPGAMSSREDNEGRLVAVADLPQKTLERVLASAKFETTR
jgi:negative regulator of sigma E activity